MASYKNNYTKLVRRSTFSSGGIDGHKASTDIREDIDTGWKVTGKRIRNEIQKSRQRFIRI